ncbi:hypothetical protein C8J57DRAFT_1058369 [Mycena rebaudengoi]|nr:hypothetical protein C8J57DRAFT_1058369 [Mycena rebaudengoi]
MSVVPLLAGQLELRISAHSVGSYPRPATKIDSALLAAEAMAPSTNIATTSNGVDIRLLSGPLDDFVEYSGQEQSKWLVDISHDICDPAAMRGSLLVWNELAQEWRRVASTDALTASIYRYDLPDGIIVGLSKISARVGRSRSTSNESGEVSTKADRVKRRDEQCWVTGIVSPLANSHTLPKRMGDHLARIVFHTFSPPSTPIPNISIYDEMFSISLSLNLGAWFREYNLGLRLRSENQYECHNFVIVPAGHVHTILGGFDASNPMAASFPILHGSTASPPRPECDTIPPPGLIRWHYLQCVIKRFAHCDYKQLENIAYPELPLRMKGDSDDEGTDDEAEWPSKVLDCGRALQAEEEQSEQRERFVADWVDTTQ